MAVWREAAMAVWRVDWEAGQRASESDVMSGRPGSEVGCSAGLRGGWDYSERRRGWKERLMGTHC